MIESLKNVSFYEALGVAKDADEAAVRRGYKRQSLRFHPDKNTNASPEDAAVAAENFQRVKLAYDTLSDAAQRKLYDKYGERGLNMASQYDAYVDPEVLNHINAVFAISSLGLAVVILQGALLSAQVDRSENWNWNAVFVPLYILLGVATIGALALAWAQPWSANSSGATPDDASEEAAETDDAGVPLDNLPRRARRQFRRARRRMAGRALLLAAGIRRLVGVAQAVSLIVFVALVAAKLNSTTNGATSLADTSWVLVFVPLFEHEGLNLASVLTQYVVAVRAGKYAAVPPPPGASGAPRFERRPYTLLQAVWLLVRVLRFPLLRIAQSILIPLKADGVYTGAWAAVFIPGFIMPFVIVVGLIAGTVRVNRMRIARERVEARRAAELGLAPATADEPRVFPEADEAYFVYLRDLEAQLKSKLVAQSLGMALFGSLYLISLGLLVKRIDVNAGNPPPTVGVILVPLFIAVSIVLCCTCCCVPCLLYALQSSLSEAPDVSASAEEGTAGSSGAAADAPSVSTAAVPSDRPRITNS